MLSKQTLKLLFLGCLMISSAHAAKEGEENKDDNKDEKKKEDTKDVTVDVGADSAEHVKYDTSKTNHVVLTCDEGYHFKTLKVGEKTLYTVDTKKYTPKTAHKLTHGDDLFFRLDLVAAKPLLFKKKSDKEWNEYKYSEYLEKVVWKEKKEAKTLDVSKYSDTTLFSSETFGTGHVYTFKGDFKVKDVKFDSKAVGNPSNAKYTNVRVYVGSDEKKVVRLDYFYTGDDRFKETYFKLVDEKWKQLEQTEANKDLHAMNSSWPTDYKPTVDKFSPLTVLASFVIATFAVFYYL